MNQTNNDQRAPNLFANKFNMNIDLNKTDINYDENTLSPTERILKKYA